MSVDVFVVDYSEELSGINGEILQAQTEFATYCVNYIRKLYQNKKSIIGLGHSMGGLILRAVIIQPNYKQGSLNTIITLSTPHREHNYVYDPSLAYFYFHLNNQWRNLSNSNGLDVAVISISGGFRDNLIRMDNTLLTDLIKPSNGFSISTYSIPGVFISTDHQCITWCKQLIDYLCDIITDLASFQIKKQELDVLERVEVLKRLYKNQTSIIKVGNINSAKEITNKMIHITTTNETFKFHIKNRNFVLMTNAEKEELKIYSNIDKETFDISTNLRSLPYMRVDDVQEKVYPIPTELAHNFITGPKDFDYLYLNISSVNSTRLLGFYYDNIEKNLDYEATSFITEKEILNIPENNGIYKINFPYLERHFSYKMRVDNGKCQNFIIPFAYFNGSIEERYIENATEFYIKFYTPGKGFYVKIFSNPLCPLHVYLSVSWHDIFSNIFRFNIAPLISSCFSILFFSIADQARNQWKYGIYISLQNILFTRLPLFVLCSYIRKYLVFIDSFFSNLIAGFFGTVYDSNLDSWQILYNSENLYNFHFVYVILVTLSSYLIIHILVSLFVIFDYFTPKFIKFFKIETLTLICLISTFSTFLVHSGIWLTFILISLFLHDKRTKQERNLFNSMMILCICIMGIILPSTFIWLKDLFIVNGNLFECGSFDSKLTIIPFYWFLCYVKKNLSVDNSLFYELSGTFIYLFCTFGVYRVHYVFAFLIFANSLNLREKLKK